MFLSASPSADVVADKAKLTADRAHLSVDKTHSTAVITADRKQLATDLSSAITAASTQLKADGAQVRQVVQSDQASGSAKLLMDRKSIAADKRAVSADRKNPGAEATALTKLRSDDSILTADSAMLKVTLAADRSGFAARLSADSAGLNAVRRRGDSTTAADRTQLTDDLKTSGSTFAGDSKNIATDEYQLLKDEAAEFGQNLLNNL